MSKIENYWKDNKKVGYFGIKYLDDKLRGILKGDLILIGARSGAGKSTIAELIATENSKRGVKVTLLSLENFKDDNFIQKAYYKYKSVSQEWDLNQRDFASGDFKFNEYALKEAEKYAESQYKNVNIVNRQHFTFGIESLKKGIIEAVEKNESELIIIDHIDYLDKEPNQSDNEHITCLMREIRDAQYAFRVPVVAISHLRKSNSKDDVKVPGLDEFIGSSNKVKESTCVIMLAPDDEENMQDSKYKGTWCCIRKLRQGGIDNTAAKIYFDSKKGEYTENYTVYHINYSGTKIL